MTARIPQPSAAHDAAAAQPPAAIEVAHLHKTYGATVKLTGRRLAAAPHPAPSRKRDRPAARERRPLLPRDLPRRAFPKLVQNEARLVWRQPVSLGIGLVMPVLLLALLGGAFRGASLGGLSVAQAELPMLIVLVLATIALFGLPAPLATYREQGILRRLSTTPVPPAWVLGAQLAVNASIAVAGLMVLLVTGIAGFGLKTPQSVGGLALSVALAAVAVFGIGLWITGIASNAAMAGGIAWVTFFPLTFFAGVFVPLPILPAVVRDIGDWTPLGAAVHALQDATQAGFPPARFLLVLTGYALVSGALAIRFFRWE